MALRDQPYIPLYVRDVLTDEKLIECSAVAHGVYFRLLCILHKQEKYGLLCLKQKYKQNTDKNILLCFSDMLSRQMPFSNAVIEQGLSELIDEGVLTIKDDTLYQKRMVKDGEISIIRSGVGKKGGSSVTKQYGKAGYLYLMSDRDSKHKIGISVNPQNRLYRLRSDLKLSKKFDIIEQIHVLDMGMSEDNAHSFFSKYIDGEWLVENFDTVMEDFVLFKAKLKQNAEYENANENESEFENEEDYS